VTWPPPGFGTDPAGDTARRTALASATATGPERWRPPERGAAPPLPAPADDPPVPGHLLTYRTGKAGTEVTCECGRWDGWFNGPRSRRRVLDEHATHVAAELSATAPLRVQSVRAADPEELEP
jgi:hypothetical protein